MTAEAEHAERCNRCSCATAKRCTAAYPGQCSDKSVSDLSVYMSDKSVGARCLNCNFASQVSGIRQS